MDINDKAPDFTLPDQDGNKVSLKEFRGKTVVFYFYPRANTPGCTIEACEFRDEYSKFKKQGMSCWAFRPILRQAEKKFAEKFNIPFTLLGDGQEGRNRLRRAERKEHVRQESDGRSAQHIHHWARTGSSAHLRESEARRAREGSAGGAEIVVE